MLRKKVTALGEAAVSSQAYRTSLIELLREGVPFAAACCTAIDPNTLLSTGAATEEGVEAIHAKLFEYEYLREDYNAYDDLTRKADTLATLSAATGGSLELSGRYRDVLQPAGFKDELRAALVIEGACWGYLTLFRRADQPLFDEQERSFLSSLIPCIARCLRKTSLALPLEKADWLEDEPGILMLTGQLEISSFNATAEQWLARLRKAEGIESAVLPRPIRAVCSRALSESAEGKDSPLAKVCIRMPEGPFLTIRASLLNGSEHGVQLAVWLEPAKPADMLPIITEAYALSVREKQVLEGIMRGYSTKELARSLHITAYTVQDHLKSIFAKTGVSSRRDLIWQLLSRFSLEAESKGV
ncbi:LuxR C-terminal-related transcriptional regulator [Paenibacillus sp. y28]